EENLEDDGSRCPMPDTQVGQLRGRSKKDDITIEGGRRGGRRSGRREDRRRRLRRALAVLANWMFPLR
ncbi:hypothetical protein PMAYCL1PPCAC_15279, partial [Pristionchus mayeri]